MATITLQQLVNDIAIETGRTKVETKEMLRVLFGRIRQGLENGDRTELRGFGVFEVVLRKERVARNPHTGEKVNVPAKKRVVFRVGRQLKTMVLDS